MIYDAIIEGCGRQTKLRNAARSGDFPAPRNGLTDVGVHSILSAEERRCNG